VNLGIMKGRWLDVTRTIAYWGLWLFLVFCCFFWATTGEIWDFNQDPTTYRQVYLDADLHIRISWAYAVLTGIAIPFQAAGLKARRFSKVAVAVFALHVCFAVASDMFGIDMICCT